MTRKERKYKMEKRKNLKKEKEITFAQLFEVLKKNIVLIIIAAVVCAAIGGAYSVILDKPSYKATVSFWVNVSSDRDNYTSSSLTMASSSLATSFTELICQPDPLSYAVEAKNLTEALGYESDAQCLKKITSMMKSFKNDTDSALFFVTVNSDSRDTTYKVIEAVQEVMPDVLEKLCDDKVTVRCAAKVPAPESVVPSKSSPIVMGVLGGFVGAIIAYVIFFVISLFDTAVYGEKTISSNFDYPIVGYIPSMGQTDKSKTKKFFKTTKNGPNIASRNYESKLICETTPFLVTEAFNTLRTNLVYSAVAAKSPIFAVSSDIAGAGKTVVSSNLAISFANLGKKVLLVECDMRCPAFSKLFSKNAENGLSDLLAGMYSKTEELIVDVGIANLDVLFCGKIPPNPSELLSGYRMSELAEEWKGKYDYIILDMPPLGEVFDAGVVSSIVNGYVIAVRCNYSDVDIIRESANKVESVNGNVLGFVLNDISPKNGKKYKRYYGMNENR